MLRSFSNLLQPPISPLSSSSSTTRMPPLISTVEHIVLFKIRPSAPPALAQSMLSNLRRLSSLNLATHLAAGPILRLRSAAATALGFTHILHGRYRSQPDLAAYSAHPSHQAVVRDHVLPICDDIMAVDWVAAVEDAAGPAPGSVVRVMLARPREGVAAAEVVREIGGLVAGSAGVSYGENFSPGRAKGYGVGFLSVFPGVEEADAADGDGEVERGKEKIRPLVDGVVVVDFLVPVAVSDL